MVPLPRSAVGERGSVRSPGGASALLVAAIVVALVPATVHAGAGIAIATVAVADPATTASAAAAAAGASSVQAALRDALASPAPASGQSGLRFGRDAAVAKRVRDEMAARVTAQGGGDLLEAVQDDRLLREFDRLMRRYGYAPDDLGDVLAAYLVLAWETVNDADVTTRPEGIRAARRQVSAAVGGMANFRGMDAAARQAQAQRTAYMAMVAATSRQVFKARGEREALAQLQRDVRKQVQDTAGIDLADYTLTDAGFAPAR